MATLKGQNLRILTRTGDDWYVVAMATNCTISLQGNQEDASTKDDVGLASKPTITSKSWSVSVESLDVSDTAAMLTAIKNLYVFHLMWDETSTSDNQTLLNNAIHRTGDAYLTDATFTFNDRENSAKSLQFSGIGGLQTTTDPQSGLIAPGSYTKGQFVRLFLSSDNTTTPSSVIAAAKQLSLHVALTLEDASTKDTSGDWLVQEPTGLTYDISSNALVRSGDTITSQVAGKTLSDIETIFENSLPVKWQIANVSGANQRTKGSILCSGSAIIQSLNIQAQNRQTATYDISLLGYGAYTVSA